MNNLLYYFQWFEYCMKWASIYVWIVPVINIVIDVVKSNQEEEVCQLNCSVR